MRIAIKAVLPCLKAIGWPYDANIDSHSGIQQGEELHNLVRIENNGAVISQRLGETGAGPCEMRALAHNSHYDYASANITPVYGGQPEVAKVEREFLFIKPRTFLVFDRVQASGANARKVWTLNVPVQPLVNGASVHYKAGLGVESQQTGCPPFVAYRIDNRCAAMAVTR